MRIGCATCGADNDEFRLTCSACGHQLPDTTAPMSPELPAAKPLRRLGPGDRIGRFVLERALGEGGMGVVYLAQDPELGRQVAVKIVRPERASEPARARMQREAQALARVAHPNVVVIYDVGPADDAIFLAMEYVEGETLREWLATPRPWRAILDVFRDAGAGLAAAHAVSIAHRDFKPANVLLGRDGRTRVLDFGLARAGEEVDATLSSSSASGSAAQLTETGALIGTPAYMAPEQWRSKPATPRSDQFSFCVALWEALHGERPFMAGGRGEPSWKLKPPPAGDVPVRIDRILERGLSVEPDARWPSMTLLLAALAADPAARRRRIAVLAGVVALVAAGASAVAVSVARRMPAAAVATDCALAARPLEDVWNDARRGAITKAVLASGSLAAKPTSATVVAAFDRRAQAWRAERGDICAATFVRHQQSDALLDRRMACGDAVLGRLDALVRVWLAADRQVVDHAGALVGQIDSLPGCPVEVAAPPADPAVRAFSAGEEAMLQTADALHYAHKAAIARLLVAHVVDEARALGLKVNVARALKAWADVLPPREGEQRYKEAVTAAEEAGDDVEKAKAWRGLAFLHGVYQRRFEEAHQDLAYARSAGARAGGPDTRTAAVTDQAEAIVLAEEGRGAEGVPLAERSIAALAPIDGEGPLLAGELINTANVETKGKRFAEARAHYEQARTLLVRLFGEDYPSAPDIDLDLGGLAFYQQDYAGALPLHERAVEGYRRLGNDHAADLGRGLIDLADDLRHLDRPAESLAAAKEAADLLGAALGPSSGSLADALEIIGAALLIQGHAAEAIEPLTHCLDIRERNHDAPEAIADAQLALARASWTANQNPRARTLAESAKSGFQTAHNEEGIKGATEFLATLR